MATHTDHSRTHDTVIRQGERKLNRKAKDTDRYLADRAFQRLMREVNGR